MNLEDLQRHLEKMDLKAESNHKEIAEKISSIDATLIKQASDLAYHIRRTDLLDEELKVIRSDVAPVKVHVDRMEFFIKWSFKVLGGSSILTIVGYGLKAFLGL